MGNIHLNEKRGLRERVFESVVDDIKGRLATRLGVATGMAAITMPSLRPITTQRHNKPQTRAVNLVLIATCSLFTTGLLLLAFSSNL